MLIAILIMNIAVAICSAIAGARIWELTIDRKKTLPGWRVEMRPETLAGSIAIPIFIFAAFGYVHEGWRASRSVARTESHL